MLDLMAVSTDDGSVPLYVHTLSRILRRLRLEEQNSDRPFEYSRFIQLVENEGLSPGQKAPLQQRLDTLESFMARRRVKPSRSRVDKSDGNDWSPKVGEKTKRRASIFWSLILPRRLLARFFFLTCMPPKRKVRTAHHSRPFLPMHNSIDGMFIIQYLSESIHRAAICRRGPRHRAG